MVPCGLSRLLDTGIEQGAATGSRLAMSYETDPTERDEELAMTERWTEYDDTLRDDPQLLLADRRVPLQECGCHCDYGAACHCDDPDGVCNCEANDE